MAKHCEYSQQIKHLKVSLEEMQEIIDKHRTIKEWAYIIHDKDVYTKKDEEKNPEHKEGTLKKPHIHLYLNFGQGSATFKDVARWFKDEPQYVGKVHGRKADMLLYLTHRNVPEKYQYKDDEVVSNFDLKQAIEEDQKNHSLVNEADKIVFDFMQETNDYYFTPLTGTYIRVVRYIVFVLALFLVPTWYLLVSNASVVPEWLSFIIPRETGRIPLIAQLLLTEFIIDGLRMASLNTPSMLSNSLSVVGGLILGDFAVGIGWLIPEVILYMAFVAIATFTQRSYELGYAFKFLRIGLLIMTAVGNVWGYAIGTLLIVILLATNQTVNGKRHYLYPLLPFDGRALLTLLVRRKKQSDIHAKAGHR